MSRSIVSWGIALTLIGGGCATNRGALKDENSRLLEQLTELKAERRRDRRSLRDMERQLVLKDRGARPRLRVDVVGPEPPHVGRAPAVEPEPVAPEAESLIAEVAVEPGEGTGEETGEVAYADDDVEIVYVGEAAKEESVRPSIKLYEHSQRTAVEPAATVPVARARVGDRIPVTRGKVPPLPREAKRPAVDPGELYKQLYQALRDRKHDEAIEGFRAFVAEHATHEYADNAQYWLGEAYYDRRDYERALVEFVKVEKLFPSGNKVSDATLKIAFCKQHLGALDEARAVLTRVIERFPKSNAAVIAADRLGRLQADN